jgi:hypothetical protein
MAAALSAGRDLISNRTLPRDRGLLSEKRERRRTLSRNQTRYRIAETHRAALVYQDVDPLHLFFDKLTGISR